MDTVHLVGWLLVIFIAGAIAGSVERGNHYRLEIQALHTQIEKQNCEENTIPSLRKELLGK